MDSSGAVGLDESPSPPLEPLSSPLPGPRSPRGLFYGESPSEEETEEDSLTSEGAGAGSSTADPWTDQGSEFLDESEPDSWTGSPAGERPAQLLSKAQMRATARTAVQIGTGMAHTVAAKTPAQQQVGLYLADKEDCAAIGEPLADIAYRRGDVVGGKLSPDANDLLRSMMGVAGYFAKQVAKIGEVRRLEAGAAAAEVQHLPTPDVA